MNVQQGYQAAGGAPLPPPSIQENNRLNQSLLQAKPGIQKRAVVAGTIAVAGAAFFVTGEVLSFIYEPTSIPGKLANSFTNLGGAAVLGVAVYVIGAADTAFQVSKALKTGGYNLQGPPANNQVEEV